MKFAIRDDDLNYSTKPEDLENIYGKIWDKIPVSFAAVPFIGWRYFAVVEYAKYYCSRPLSLKFIRQIEEGEVPGRIFENQASFKKNLPLSENSELVSFIKKKLSEGKISLMLHGYAHDVYRDGYEFETGKDLFRKVGEGKKYLEGLFGTNIKTFVAPNNSLSEKGASAVAGNGLDFLISFGYYPWERRVGLDSLKNFLSLFLFTILHGKKKRIGRPLIFKDHQEFPCYVLSPNVSLEEMKEGIDFAAGRGEDFCLATHYYAFKEDPGLHEKLDKFLGYVREKYGDRIEYVKADELFEK